MLSQGTQTVAFSKVVPLLPNSASPTRTSVLPLLASTYNATAGCIMATAGEPTQLVVTPFDDFGNKANVTTPTAYRILVETMTRGRQRRRRIQSVQDPTIVDVSLLQNDQSSHSATKALTLLPRNTLCLLFPYQQAVSFP